MTIGAVGAYYSSRLSALEERIIGVVKEVDATMKGTEKAVTKELDAKIAGSEKAVDAKIIGFEKAADQGSLPPARATARTIISLSFPHKSLSPLQYKAK